VEAMTTNTPSPVNYQLADVTRNSKVVGVIRSDIPIMKGDRVFLGDDIWDVDFVKVFTLPTSKVGDIQWYRSGTVELLVTFGGKAADRANSAK
jgi:3-deoxy-D-manno-octulosonate 8-phosphate phosphatase KdsC-like HAD superfamily phosphatase